VFDPAHTVQCAALIGTLRELAHWASPTKEKAAELDNIINQIKADQFSLEKRDFS
jgi:hypothetical protein